jgi:hypothetical protein
MKHLLLIILSIIAFSCETDVDVIDYSGSVPIVYCVLNQDDTVHRLRISRSYLSTNGTIAPASSDSLTIPGELNISIEAVDKDQVTDHFPFEPIPIQKDSGFFPHSVNGIFQGIFAIKENTMYRLILEIKEWDYVAYSSFVTLGDFQLVDPSFPEVRDIHMLEDHNPIIHWTKCQNAAVYQVGIRVHYQEMKAEQIESKSRLFLFTTTFYRDDPGSFYSYSINSNQFYKRMSESIQVDPACLRKLTSIDVCVIAGSESVGVYMTTQEQQDPFQVYDYTNMINGQGIFGSCKTVETKGFILDDQSLDSLAYGNMTKSLNFFDSNGYRKN